MFKPSNNGGKIHQVKYPGDCISVDQLDSSTTGFIAHLNIRPTKQRYFTVTTFTDQHSDLSYMHLHNTLTSEETV